MPGACAWVSTVEPPGLTALFSLQEPPSRDLKEGPFWEDQCPLEGESFSPKLIN